MLLASDALSKFDGSTGLPTSPAQQQPSAPPHQPPVAEAHPTPPAPSAPKAATETASVPSQPAAAAVPAPVVPVAEPQAVKTPPEGGSTQTRQEEAGQEGPPATTNLNSAKAEAKLVKALDYLVAINDNSDNPAQKWVINESILASLTGCFRPAIKKFFETHRFFINQANNTHGLGTRPQPRQGQDQPRRYPRAGQELQKRRPQPAVLIHTFKAHIILTMNVSVVWEYAAIPKNMTDDIFLAAWDINCWDLMQLSPSGRVGRISMSLDD
jgi:hypothetical protein